MGVFKPEVGYLSPLPPDTHTRLVVLEIEKFHRFDNLFNRIEKKRKTKNLFFSFLGGKWQHLKKVLK